MTTNGEQQEILQEMETETTPEKEQPKTLNLEEKRLKLREMREAAEATGRSFYDMDDDYQEAYLTLQKEIKQDTKEETELIDKLCNKGFYSKEQRERLLAVLATNQAEKESLREFASTFAAANVQLHKETNRAYEQRLQQKEQENEILRKQIEQGQVNEHGKRLRGLVQSVIQPVAQTTFAPTPKAVQQAITAPTQKTLAEQFSLIDRPEVKKTEIFDHAPLKQALDPRFNNFEPPRSHITNNPGVYAILQDFQNALPALAQSKKSYSS